MALNFQKFAILFLALGLFAFATMGIFGLGHMGGMKTDDAGDMAGCIFTGKTMLCKMDVMEHISLWQSLFVAMPQEILIFLALFIFLATVIFVAKNIPAPPRLSRDETLTKQLHLREHPDFLFFNFLKDAFSRGILHPKIYGALVS